MASGRGTRGGRVAASVREVDPARRRRAGVRLLLAVALLVGARIPLASPAYGAPVGGQQQVNTYTSGDQHPGALAMDADGDFVITWYGAVSGGGFNVRAQRYDAAGDPQGAEFLVSSPTNNASWGPDIAMAPNGDFVITWWAHDQFGWDIMAQRYSADGAPQGGRFRVNSVNGGVERDPSIAMGPDGDFIISWTSKVNDSDWALRAKRFSADGVAQGPELTANTTLNTYEYTGPDVAMDADGDFVITWYHQATTSSSSSVRAQRFDAAGAPQGAELQLASGGSDLPRLAMHSSGSFVVIWRAGSQTRAQRFDAAGAPQGFQIAVTTSTEFVTSAPGVAMADDGGFVVAWSSVQEPYSSDASGSDIYAQRFDAAGAKQGDRLQVNTYTDSQQYIPAVGMDADGDFAIAWRSDGSAGSDSSGTSIQAQLYDRAVPEVCNGEDDDLDGAADDGVTTTYYGDHDGDGYGSSASPQQACTQPSGTAIVGGDADDDDPTTYPGAPELDDGKDNNQNGLTDEGHDHDGDGYTPTHGGDCDDDDEAVNPAATEADNGIDDNCNGAVDEGLDADGDGYTSGFGGDADDHDPTTYPGAPELDDGKDNDQDGTTDEGHDGDADGYTPIAGGDCNDSAAAVHPGASEADNGIDDNCDGARDEGLDKDWDGYTPIFGGDCNDNAMGVNPGATERDNGIDDDCDGTVDETYDADRDGFTPIAGGDCNDSAAAVHPGASEADNGIDDNCDGARDEGLDKDWDGYTPVFGHDCNDNAMGVNPGATERDNGVDDDCDAAVDEGFDRDGDGYTPIGGNDRDDTDPTIHPGASELCDAKDNDQDNSIDEGFPDTDRDGKANCVDPDDDGDGIADDRDPDGLRAAVTSVPTSSFNSAGNKNAMLGRITTVESYIRSNRINDALTELTALRGRVDGCNGTSREKADNNDWITPCAQQRLIRGFLDDLIVAVRRP